MMSEDVLKVQDELESKFTNTIAGIDEAALKLYNDDKNLALSFLTDYSVSQANLTFNKWKQLSEYLLVKYIDGNVKKEENGVFVRNQWGNPENPEFPGYSEEWKKNVIIDTGDKLLMPEGGAH
jgi:hypothetical protein